MFVHSRTSAILGMTFWKSGMWSKKLYLKFKSWTSFSNISYTTSVLWDGDWWGGHITYGRFKEDVRVNEVLLIMLE